MTDHLQEISNLGSEQWSLLGQILDDFESAWRQGPPPSIVPYLPTAAPERRLVLAQLVQVDLELRFKREIPVQVETYLECFPELAQDREQVLQLITAEFKLRRQRQGDLTPESFLRRFPSYSAELRERLAAVSAPGDRPRQASPRQLLEAPPERTVVDSSTVGAARSLPAIPGYDVLGILGRGGMGIVLKAKDLRLGRLVALKMILASADVSAEAQARFHTEAQAVARLQHPHIVQIFEVGQDASQPFLCLEFVAGGSLAQKINATPQPPLESARLVETVARAIAYAHQHGILHRDLKSANVLLTAEGEPKITDFGLAKKLDAAEGHTLSGVPMGTPSYMAPEQAAGRTRQIGPAADVYALGALLYEMLTGRPPFKGMSVADTLLQVLHSEPVPPTHLRPGIPRDLETVCLKCLEKDRQKRYPSALALAEDLRRFVNGEPIQARRTPAWERLWKLARRKPVAAALALVAILAAAASVAAVAFYGLYQTQQASLYKRELQRIQEQEVVRQRSSDWLLQVRKYVAEKLWSEAKTELARAQEALDAQPELRAEELRDEVRLLQAVVQQGLEVDRRRRNLQTPYDDALFFETLFTGLDLARNRDKTRTAARSALAVYGLDAKIDASEGAFPLLEQDRSQYTPAEHLQLVTACYELLLIWAEIEAVPVPGQDETQEQRRQGADRGLALLERAARLGQAQGLQTRAYHLRKARYLALRDGESIDPGRTDPALPARPTEALDWFLDGLAYYHEEQFPEAGTEFRKVLEQQKKHFWARYVLALCYLRRARWVDAKAELTVCANQRLEFAWPRLLRGFAASELGFRHGDRQLAAEEFAAAAADFDWALGQDQDPLVQYAGLANRGVLHIRALRWTEAVRDLRAAVQVNPEGFQAYANLAQALQGQKQWDQALQALDQAIQRAPGLAVLYENRAHLHLLRRDRQAARADFEQAVDREPRDSRSERLVNNLVELGRLLHREGRHDAALAQYDRALRLRPEFTLTERFRAETLLELKRPADAGQALDRYLAATTQPPAVVYQSRGLIHAEMGEWPAAIEMYTLALKQEPGDTSTRCLRGWLYLLTDSVQLGLKDFEECVQREPHSGDALVGRGTARLRLRQLVGSTAAVELRRRLLADAVADAEAAERHGKVTDRLLYNLARFYAQAVAQLDAEGRNGRDRLAAELAARYEKRSLDYLHRTLEAVPEERRAAFWRGQVQADPALKGIQQSEPYLRLQAQYGRPRL